MTNIYENNYLNMTNFDDQSYIFQFNIFVEDVVIETIVMSLKMRTRLIKKEEQNDQCWLKLVLVILIK